MYWTVLCDFYNQQVIQSFLGKGDESKNGLRPAVQKGERLQLRSALEVPFLKNGSYVFVFPSIHPSIHPPVYLCDSVYVSVCHVCTLNLLELELQVMVNPLVWVLGTELSSGETGLNL